MRRRVDSYGNVPSANPDERWYLEEDDDDLHPHRRSNISTILFRARRALRRHVRPVLKGLLGGLLVLLLWDILWLSLVAFPERTAISEPPPANERYFIASIHWNNEAVLRSHWIPAVVDLIKHLGPQNTYTSVLESGSWDDSKGALRVLEQELSSLGAPHNIVLDPTTHIDEISRIPATDEPGWIWTPREQKELRRIPYLSRLRNAVLADMRKANDTTGRPFTKILWLNDVVFTTEDIMTLLDTRAGNYAAACSLDFAHPPSYYDTFALRDIDGNRAIMPTWPYFLSSRSRNALMANKPVPVQSCWNGVVAMDAAPYSGNSALKFRGIPDSLALSHLEGSECCLIHTDNPLASSKRVWMNPNVRVGYNPAAYDVVKVSPRSQWPSLLTRIKGLWQNRIVRLTGMPQRMIENLVVRRRVNDWVSQSSNSVPGRFETGVNCIINEMQVLISNGWKHL